MKNLHPDAEPLGHLPDDRGPAPTQAALQPEMTCENEEAPGPIRMAGLVGGPLAAAVLVCLMHPGLGGMGNLGGPATMALGLLAWMALWWMTTAVPLAATSLLPLLVLPATQVATLPQAAAPYANSIIFLFAGGAALGLALERTGLSGRFAALVMRAAGSTPSRLVSGLFIASGILSAWMSNTATAAMMLPVAMAAVHRARSVALPGPGSDAALRNLAVAALLAVAYGSSAGGLITLIGSPPNAIAADWLRENGVEMGFARWMAFSLPVAAVFTPLAIAALLMCNPVRGLSFASPRGSGAAGERDMAADSPKPSVAADHPPMDRAARVTLAIFIFTALAWVLHRFVPGLRGRVDDATFAVLAALLLLGLPLRFSPWRTVLPVSALRELPWGVLILFGGGLSLAEAMERSGLSASIGSGLGSLGDLPTPLLIAGIVGALVLASEVASNTALAATAVPIVGALAPALGLPPEKLVLPAAYGASYAFMLPVGTPPNAMVFATGRVPLRRMMGTGMVLNAIGVAVITLMASLLL